MPESKGLSLPTYLIMPVQRIPRYKLLLLEIQQKTWETHSDFKNLTLATQELERVANHVDASLQIALTMNTILNIQKAVGGTLLAAHRVFIKEGPLFRIRPGGKPLRLYIYLFNDILILTQKTGLSNIGSKMKSRAPNIPIAGLWIEDLADTPGTGF